MVSESFDISTTDPTINTTVSKKIYQVKKSIFWAILSIIVAIFIILLVLTIYFGVNQKGTVSEKTSTNPTTSRLIEATTSTMTTTSDLIETTTVVLSVERIPTNLRQEEYRLTISPNLTSETFTGLLNI